MSGIPYGLNLPTPPKAETAPTIEELVGVLLGAMDRYNGLRVQAVEDAHAALLAAVASLRKERNNLANGYDDLAWRLVVAERKLAAREAVIEAAQEIQRGPHTEICRGRCAMCRALNALAATGAGKLESREDLRPTLEPEKGRTRPAATPESTDTPEKVPGPPAPPVPPFPKPVA